MHDDSSSSARQGVGPIAVHPETGAPVISARVADWSRESKDFWSWHPSRSLLASLRAYERAAAGRGIAAAASRKLAVLRHRFWSMVTGADIPLGCRLGGGLLLPHPNGVVIHPKAEVGPNCLIFQQVTLAEIGGAAPRLGGHVDVGAGAKILGGIVVGDDALIGANAVVLQDVPAGATAVGIPARIVR
jgi:serine O-acetyltransferase